MKRHIAFLLFLFGCSACAQETQIQVKSGEVDSLAYWMKQLDSVQGDLRSLVADSAKRKSDFMELGLSYKKLMNNCLSEISDTNRRNLLRKDWLKMLALIREKEESVQLTLDQEIQKRKLEFLKKEADFLKKVRTLTSGIVGSRIVEYRGSSYRVFISDTSLHAPVLLWKHPHSQKRLVNIESVLKWYSDSSRGEVLLVANAGMYTPQGAPQGLYIQNKKELIPLDTLGPRENLNFYLKPNGVFWFNSEGRAGIQTTEKYLAESKSPKHELPDFATQSGPMLVINGEIHPSFRFGSKNLNIRNGVGLIHPYKMVFAISNQPVNLYDFAAFYRDILGCEDALYLDGAISRMYQHDIFPKERGGDFGPMICILKRKNPKE